MLGLPGAGVERTPWSGSATIVIVVNCPVIGSAMAVAVSNGTVTAMSFTVGTTNVMVNVICADVVPVAFVALTVTVNVPPVVGVPEITPVVVSSFNPGGRPVAAKLVGLFVAVIWYVRGTPLVPFTVAGLVMPGAESAIVIVTARLPVPVPLVALTFVVKTPLAAGTPEMTPFAVLTTSPGGRPVALKLVGPLVAAIW